MGFILFLNENPQIPLNLVIAGKKGWESTKLSLSDTSYKDRIIFTGFVDDADIASLYSEAIAMSYLSFYEGFGLPVLEGMACGCPVVCANVTSLPEVTGDTAVYFNPEIEDEMFNSIKKLWTNDNLRLELQKRGLKRSEDFSWEKAAAETVKIYQLVANNMIAG